MKCGGTLHTGPLMIKLLTQRIVDDKSCGTKPIVPKVGSANLLDSVKHF